MAAPNSNRPYSWRRDGYTSNHSEESLELTESNHHSLENSMDRPMEDFLRATSATTSLGTEGIIDSPEQSTFTDTQYFPPPVFYRVLCIGSVSPPSKKEVVKKIGMGLVQVLKNDNSGIMAISRFKEVKHHLIDLTLIDGKEDMDSFEDNGASLIEADFTWDSNAFDIYSHPHLEALHYAWDQTPEGSKFKLGWMKAEVEHHDFNGFAFPDETPNGIDLCIYFYGGDDKDHRTQKDFDLLRNLSLLGVLILPITSVPNLDKRHLAGRLSQRNIKCLDLTDIKMERPSFGSNNRARRSRIDDTTPQLQHYEILDMTQLIRIQNSAIYKLLKKSRFRMATREKLSDIVLEKKKQPKESFKSVSSSSASQHQHAYSKFGMIAMFVVLAIAAIVYFLPFKQTSLQSNWIASFEMDLDQQFLLFLKRNDKFSWPNHDPQVWINSKDKAAIERVSGDPGAYKVMFPMIYNTIFFTLNSSVKTDNYMLANNQTFIWLNKSITPASDHYFDAVVHHPMLFFKAMLYGDGDGDDSQ